jgi:hypothetical protein
LLNTECNCFDPAEMAERCGADMSVPVAVSRLYQVVIARCGKTAQASPLGISAKAILTIS